MTSLPESLKHWNSARFDAALKSELAGLEDGILPLQQAATHGGMIDCNSLSLTLISTTDNQASLVARVGIFFNEIVGGCACGDEPFEANAYCVIDISLDKTTAAAQFALVDDA